jgi:putative DNA primase/helicase
MKVDAETLVRGRWPEILIAAGMSQELFTQRHGPCPFCGGDDRYRWSNKHDGVWVCSFCTESRFASGFRMLMQHMGYSTFHQAADHVRDYFREHGHSPSRVAAAPACASSTEDVARNMKRMQTIWDQAKPVVSDDPVDRYLQRRIPGLDIPLEMVRYHPALDYWAPPPSREQRPILLGRFPAMVVKALDANDQFVQLHKTYLTSDGEKANVPVVKKTERGIGVNGFAVPIMPFKGDTLGLAEGIESALAAAMLRGIPVWPCLNGPSMAAFDVPASLDKAVKRVIIFADHDPLKPVKTADGRDVFRRAGSHYAQQAADRARARGKRVLVIKACRVGEDMANQWIECRARAIQAL